MRALSDGEQTGVLEIVTAWTNASGAELTAARAMYDLACLLNIEPPKPVAGKVRRRSDAAR